MIDSICLKIPFKDIHYNADHEDFLFSIKIRYLTYHATSRVDTSQHQDIYVPRMVVKRCQYVVDYKTGKTSDVLFFYITASIPKLLYGENLSEVGEDDFEKVVKKLKAVMQKCGIYIEEEDIVKAEVREVHFSKNIILRHSTTAKTLQILNSGYINKLHNKYREYVNDGQQVSFTSGTNDLVFYNKRLEIKSNCSKLKIDGELREAQAGAWLKAKNLEILRIEVKLKNVKKIKDLCKKLNLLSEEALTGPLKFETLFSEKVAKAVILDYYEKVYFNIAIPEKGSFSIVAEKILESKDIAGRRKFNNIGAAFCLLHFGRNRAIEVSYKNTLEVEKIIREIRATETKDEDKNSLDEVYNQIERFELINGLESSQLTEEDEEIIGYRKRKITQDEEEQIYAEALNKYLPEEKKARSTVLRKMIDLNQGKPLPETNEEILHLYYEYEKAMDANQMDVARQRLKNRGKELPNSKEIINPQFVKDGKKKKESKKVQKAQKAEVIKWLKEEAEKERKDAELLKQREKKRANYEAKQENIRQRKTLNKKVAQVEKEILLTPEEIYADDPYGLEMYYDRQKMAKETPEERKKREDAIEEQKRKIREIERTARNIIICDYETEDLKKKQEGKRVIFNPNFRPKKQISETTEAENSSDKTQYNDSS